MEPGFSNGNIILIERLAVALAIGLLIGLERGWERRELPEGQRAAGFRTFGMLGLLGGVVVQFGGALSIWLLAVATGVVGLLTALGYWRESASAQDVSITSPVAALLTVCLGGLAGQGALTAASSAAVVVTLLLGFKPELHRIIRLIDRAELLATLRLLLISIVMLPILPNRNLGPWQALNPYRIWWMVVLVAAVSYAGYFSIKLLGEKRGILMTGLCGGMVSSTAVTIRMARQAREPAAVPDLLAAAVAVATAMMFPRMLVIVAAVSPLFAAKLSLPLIFACALTFAAAGLFAALSRKVPIAEGAGPHHEPENPLDLKTALQFGAFLAVMMLLARAATSRLGQGGLYLLAALDGLIDVDAISLSCASMVGQGQLTIGPAVIATLLAAAVNNILKPLIIVALGNVQVSWRVALAMAAGFIGGGIGLWAMIHFAGGALASIGLPPT